jgi:hypothetical protein
MRKISHGRIRDETSLYLESGARERVIVEHDTATVAHGFSKASKNQHPHEPWGLVMKPLEYVYATRDGEDGDESSIGPQVWVVSIDGCLDWAARSHGRTLVCFDHRGGGLRGL